MTTGKTIVLTRRTFVGKVISLLLNMLSRLVITFLPRSKRLLISWLQSPSPVEKFKTWKKKWFCVIPETKFMPPIQNALKKKKRKKLLIQLLFHLLSPVTLFKFLPRMYGMTKVNKSSSPCMDNSLPVIKGEKQWPCIKGSELCVRGWSTLPLRTRQSSWTPWP